MRALLVFFIFTLALPGQAEQHRLQPDFTFRRVKPPAPGHTGPRITVQIGAPTPDVTASNGAPPDTYAWFWTNVPTAADHPAAERTAKALATLAAPGPSVQTMRLSELKAITDSYGTALLVHSVGTQVSPALALAVIAVESGGNPKALSPKGAVGLMQLMPATAAAKGVADPSDPAQNIKAGIAYLNELLARFDQDLVLALAAYNAGPGAVAQHKGIPPFAETRAYVPKVLAAWRVARGLCQSPPELTSDGCVFVR